MQREEGLKALREARLARYDAKAIREAQKESRPSFSGKSANHVLAGLQEEVKDTAKFDCACLLAASSKPKQIAEATAIFEALVNKEFRVSDCRRQLGALCLLEGRYREASEWLAHPSLLVTAAVTSPSSASSSHPPWVSSISKELIFEGVNVSARDVLKWSLELEIEERAKKVKEFKAKFSSEFNPKELIVSKTNYQRQPSDKSTFAFASLLSHSSMEQHRHEALSLFEGLAEKGFRRSVCQGRRGLLYFMADHLELAASFLQASVDEAKREKIEATPVKESRNLSPARRKDSPSRHSEDEIFRNTVQTVLEWATGTLTCWERLDPQKVIEQEALEQAAEEERRISIGCKKKRESVRQQWLKLEADKAEKLQGLEASLRLEGIPVEEIARRMEDCLDLESAKAAAARAFVAKNALASATAQVAITKAAAIEPQKLADAAAAQVARTRLEGSQVQPSRNAMQCESAQDRMAKEAQERLLSLRRNRTPKDSESSGISAEQSAQAVDALERAEAVAKKAKQQVDDALEAEKTARLALEVAEEDLRFRLSLFTSDQIPVITAAQTAAQQAAVAAISAAKCAARAVANAETAENAVALVAAAVLRASANMAIAADEKSAPTSSSALSSPVDIVASFSSLSHNSLIVLPPSCPPPIILMEPTQLDSFSSSSSPTQKLRLPPPPPITTDNSSLSVNASTSPVSSRHIEPPSPANVSGAILDNIFGTSDVDKVATKRPLGSPSRVGSLKRFTSTPKIVIAPPRPPPPKVVVSKPLPRPPPRPSPIAHTVSSPSARATPPAVPPVKMPVPPAKIPTPPIKSPLPSVKAPTLPIKPPISQVKSPCPPPRNTVAPLIRSSSKAVLSPRVKPLTVPQQDPSSILDGIFDKEEPSVSGRRPASPSSKGSSLQAPLPKPLKRGPSSSSIR